MIKGLGHTAIRTSDLEKSIEFYTETLGLKEAFRLNDADGKPFIVYIYVGPRQFIELFPNGTKEAQYTKEQIGLVHICLEVDDVEAAYKELQGKQVPFDTGIVDGKAKCRQFWIHDPDGTPIELMELPPASLQAQAIARMEEV